MDLEKYTIVVKYNVQDELYEAKIKELEGCSALGDTPEEAISEIRKYLPIYLEALEDLGLMKIAK